MWLFAIIVAIIAFIQEFFKIIRSISSEDFTHELYIYKSLRTEDGEKVYDMEQYFRMLKIESISDTMTHYDVVNGITGTIKIRDNLSFNDCCYKIEKEG